MKAANAPRRLARGIVLALAAVLLLGACAMVRVAYNNADALVRVMAQEYFDLWQEDSTDLRVHIASLHDWHRREELPLYAELLLASAGRLADGLTGADVAWVAARARERYRALAARAADEAAPLLVRLGPDHYAALEKKFADNNAKFAKEFLGDDPGEREKARVKRLAGYIEDWTGSLSAAQRARVRAAVRAFPRLRELQLASRQARQQELLALLRQKHTAAELAPALRAYFTEWEAHRGNDYGRMATEWEAQLTAMLVDIDRTLTAEQRARAVKRALQYAEDFRALSGAKT